MEYTPETDAIVKKANDENLIIIYSSSWCSPCKMMAPHIEKAAKEINIIKVDTDEANNLSSQEGVRAVPTIIHYKKGAEVGRQVGGKTKDQLVQLLNS